MDKKVHCALGAYSQRMGEVSGFAAEYRGFMSTVHGERERVNWVVQEAEKKGFVKVELGDGAKVPKGAKGLIYVNKSKGFVLARFGKGKFELPNGFMIIGSHLDVPHLDFKVNPLKEDTASSICLAKLHYYGGIKKYQWGSTPLLLVGDVILENGKHVHIKIGQHDKPDEPVFVIPDLLIHLWAPLQADRKAPDVLKGSELQAIVSSIPSNGKGPVVEAYSPTSPVSEEDKTSSSSKEKSKASLIKTVLSVFERYEIKPNDIQYGEFSLYPATEARWVGLDKGMVGGPGQDDGVCTYAMVKAILDDDNESPERPNVAIGFDREEIGSNGLSGAQSSWLQMALLDICTRINGKEPSLLDFNVCCSKSFFISADVCAAINPLFKSVHDELNAIKSGHGVGILRYTGSRGKTGTSDAHAEAMRYVERCLTAKNVPFQMGMLGEVDIGGGGTVCKFVTEQLNCYSIDIGTPVMSMHSPFELTQVCDVFSTFETYKAMFAGAKKE